ncbi:MAG: lytic transglycosylase domain-containing protein [Xanthobacteraceae bacterium]
MPADANSPNVPRPPALIPNVQPSIATVTGAIRKAAQSTGANFDYLLTTAKVESNLDPNSTISTSTATGLFQFLDQTWLGVMKTAGRAFGFERYADAISQTGSGRYVVEDAALRDEMMKLRRDPAANATMGGVITQQNAAVLASRIGRKPTEGELYVAHFFGPHAAARVIQLAASEPNSDAVVLFPEAARANRSVFYDRQGNARTIAGVRDELVRRYQVAKARMVPSAAPTTVAAPSPTAPVSVAPTPRVADTAGVTGAFAAAQPAAPSTPAAPTPETAGPPTRSAFHSLFETENRRGAISPVVAALWTPRGSPSGESGAPLDHLYQEPRNTQHDGS